MPSNVKRSRKHHFLPRITRQPRLSPGKLLELVRHASYLAKSIKRLNALGLISLSIPLADHLQELLSNNPYLRKKHSYLQRLIESTDEKIWPCDKQLSDIGIGNGY